MTEAVLRFGYQDWHNVEPDMLQKGDDIVVQSEHGDVVVVRLLLPPEIKEVEDGIRSCALHATQDRDVEYVDERVIEVQADALHAVCTLLGVRVFCYEDNSVQIRDDEKSPGVVFSPRLADLDALERFAKAGLPIYKGFAELVSKGHKELEEGVAQWW